MPKLQMVAFQGATRKYVMETIGATTWFISEPAFRGGERIGTINYPGNIPGKPYHAIPSSKDMSPVENEEEQHHEMIELAIADIIATHEELRYGNTIYRLGANHG